jgi:hypothetical protein
LSSHANVGQLALQHSELRGGISMNRVKAAATALFLLASCDASAMTCLKASVTIPNSPPKDEYYCYNEGSRVITDAMPNGSYVIPGMGPSLSTMHETNGPTPPSLSKQANIKCGADKYGTKYPHVPGYVESFVPGFGYVGEDKLSYVLPKQNPVHPFVDKDLDGDTTPDHQSLLYYYGWHAGKAYNGMFLDSWEFAIYVLVHERGHQNGVDDDAEGGLNDQAGLAAALAYRADNHGAKCAGDNP